jgi:hypothetical protein
MNYNNEQIYIIESQSNHKLIEIPFENGTKQIEKTVLINNVIKSFGKQYPFLNELKQLSNNINMTYTASSNNSLLDFTFIFNNNNKIIIGIYPFVSLRIKKVNTFKFVKDEFIFKKAQEIFINMIQKL